MVGWLMFSMREAAMKLPVRATAWKERIWTRFIAGVYRSGPKIEFVVSVRRDENRGHGHRSCLRGRAGVAACDAQEARAPQRPRRARVPRRAFRAPGADGVRD